MGHYSIKPSVCLIWHKTHKEINFMSMILYCGQKGNWISFNSIKTEQECASFFQLNFLLLLLPRAYFHFHDSGLEPFINDVTQNHKTKEQNFIQKVFLVSCFVLMNDTTGQDHSFYTHTICKIDALTLLVSY